MPSYLGEDKVRPSMEIFGVAGTTGHGLADGDKESDAIVTQVLDELGLQLTDELTAVPAPASGSLAPAGKAGADKAAPVAVGADDDLQARLENLRKDDDD